MCNKGQEAISVSIIHRGHAHILPTPNSPSYMGQASTVSSLGNSNLQPVIILQVAFVSTSGRSYFVVASTFGVQIFDEGGSVILFSYDISKSPVSAFDTDASSAPYAVGIAKLSTRPDTASICVGASSGGILVLSAMGLDISFSSMSRNHDYSVTCLAGLDRTLISGDTSGTVMSWKIDNNEKLNRTSFIRGPNWSCTCLCAYYDLAGKAMAVAAFGSGHLRIYEAATLALRAEVAAHSRWITGLDVAPETRMLISCSEDSIFTIWQLNPDECTPIDYVCSSSVANHKLLGARFLNSHGTSLCLSSFESNFIHCFNLTD
ncbi:WD repeat-containing protein 54-like [Neocloeon triangulifer]|uniref:WD repeat-containing protein 54-like n=1 Tax=Neocloeon triangulifer TaxID=2078957 RepID=UPI00286F0918|nr:WD repeat-containing protein 54-like [Neocloeon triangulifer]